MNPRACCVPGCSAEIPLQLDEYGARGWYDVLVTLRPLAHGADRTRRFRMCPAHASALGAMVNA